MSIRVDIINQVRQTTVPAWRPLLPLFEAVMNSFQAIKEANLPPSVSGRVLIEVSRDTDLFNDELPRVTGFRITDNGIGLNDDNFDSFNTAFSAHKLHRGGKGLGRFTWLKAFEKAEIESTFRDEDGLHTRRFTFDEQYDLDGRGLPKPAPLGSQGTSIRLLGLRRQFKDQCPRDPDVLIQKIIEHFILVFLEADCPQVEVHDVGKKHSINKVFQNDYRDNASTHAFDVNGQEFSLYGFRLPTSRTKEHKLVYAADQRAVLSDQLGQFIPNLGSRLEDNDGKPFFYLAVLQSPYLSQHVNPNRTDFDFGTADDAEYQLALSADKLIPREAIRNAALPFIQKDLENVIQSINAAKFDKVREYVQESAPEYKILLKYADAFLDKLPPRPTRNEMEAALHKELHQRETELRNESRRIVREADKIEDYDEYHRRLTYFIDQYNELGVSALAQYVSHRKIILEFLERAIQQQGDTGKYPLEEVVHKLVFPMQSTSDDVPYHEQNLWMIDERLTYHSLIASDKQLRSINLLRTKSAQRGDIVVFDEKIVFSDVDPAEHPISAITTVEFKRPGRDDYTTADNPLSQAFRLIDEIRASKFQVKGRPVTVSNKEIPASAYCICDLTPSFRQVLKDFDAFATPDNQGYYGFHRGYGTYYEVIDYDKMLRDAKKRNRIFFDKLKLPSR